MVTISCSAKLHAFALAEQMEKNNQLDVFFTSYASPKNTMAKRLVNRIDRERIPPEKIFTLFPLAVLTKIFPARAHTWNDIFDKWVAAKLDKSKSGVFIGWSGMSLYSMRVARGKGIKTILERGSSHIVYQNNILKEEYKRFGIDFAIHPAVIEKELQEYREADYISVPSYFVKDSFISQGIPVGKLLINPYGASSFFTPAPKTAEQKSSKFRIVYLGTLSFRKGLIYFFEALGLLSLSENLYEVWFIGNIAAEIKPIIEKYKRDNWIFMGKIDHYELGTYLSQCDLGVQPSIEEGLSMVILQLMSCAVPVIATTNTGGANIIQDNVSGCIVPVRSPAAIAEKIEQLFYHTDQLSAMKKAAASKIQNGFTWNDYGDRYINTLRKIIHG